jgi:endonuclease/exonuclease/phosphatase family metal-dependent hydrolase
MGDVLGRALRRALSLCTLLSVCAIAAACGSDDGSGDDPAAGGSAGTSGGGSGTGGAQAGASGTSGNAASAGSGGAASGGSAGQDGGLAGNAGIDGGAGAAAATLIAATVNARCLLDDWNKRKGPLADGIAAVDPDLIALQEICHTSSKDAFTELFELVSQKTGKGYQSVRYDTHYNLLAFADEGIAIVTPHPITFEQKVDLPDGVFNRGAIVARVQTPAGSVLFAGTHLDFGLANVRQEELSVARSAIEAVRLPGEPVILAGDMNEKPGGPCIQDAIAAGYADSWKTLHPNDPGLTSPASDPKDRIDYVLVSDPSAKLLLTQAVVFLDQPVGGVWPSDHRGVWAGFSAQP